MPPRSIEAISSSSLSVCRAPGRQGREACIVRRTAASLPVYPHLDIAPPKSTGGLFADGV
jgi:hypothetical protein